MSDDINAIREYILNAPRKSITDKIERAKALAALALLEAQQGPHNYTMVRTEMWEQMKERAAQKPRVPMAMLEEIYESWVSDCLISSIRPMIREIAARYGVEVE